MNAKDLALWTAQLEALREAWLWTPEGRKAAQRQAVAEGGRRARKAADARLRRAARPYLDPDVVLPVGVPKVDTMREAKKRPCAVYALWPEFAPATGCREIRGASGVHEQAEARRSREYQTWRQWADQEGWHDTVRAVGTPLPTD